MAQINKEKYESRYKLNSHMRGILLGVILTVIFYEFIA